MAITILPPNQSGLDAFTQAFLQSYLPRQQLREQMALQQMMREQEYPYEIQKALISGGMAQPYSPELTQQAQPTVPQLPSSMPFLQKAQSQYTRPDFTAGGIPFKYAPSVDMALKEAQLKNLGATTELYNQYLEQTKKGKGGGIKGVSISKSGPTVQFGETPEEQMEREIETAGAKKAGDIKTEIQAIDNMVDSIYDAADRLIPAVESPKQAEKIGMQRSLGSMSILGMRPQRAFGLSNENVIAYNEIMKAEATPIIRSMGEKGMLTNQDIERALGLFAKNADSIQLRQTRKEELKKFLKSKVKAFYKSETIPETNGEDTEYQNYLKAIGGQ